MSAQPWRPPGDRVAVAGARALQLSLSLGALWGLLTLAWTVAQRIGFPWPLEWMEGGVLQHAQRLASGRSIYVAPSAEFVPYLYPPLAYLPPALALWLFGPSLVAARVAAALGGGLLLAGVARLAQLLTRSWRAGLFAAGLFAIGFGYCGAFFDLLRVDAWFVALLVWGVVAFQRGRDAQGLLWLSAAACAKQPGLLVLAAASVAVLAAALRARRDAWATGRAAARAPWRALARAWGALAAALVWLQWRSDGWFARYVFELPAGHGLSPRYLASFVAVDLLLYLPVLTAGALLFAAQRRRARTAWTLDACVVAALALGALGRAHAGGHDNVRMPAFALLCAYGAAPLLSAVQSPARPLRTRAVAAVALWVQLAWLWQAPSYHAPASAAAARFAALAQALRRCADGGGVAMDYPTLSRHEFVHTMALSDLRMGDNTGLARAATAALVDRLEGPRRPAAIAISASFPALARSLARHYAVCARLPAPPMASGFQPARQVIYRARERE